GPRSHPDRPLPLPCPPGGRRGGLPLGARRLDLRGSQQAVRHREAHDPRVPPRGIEPLRARQDRLTRGPVADHGDEEEGHRGSSGRGWSKLPSHAIPLPALPSFIFSLSEGSISGTSSPSVIVRVASIAR